MLHGCYYIVMGWVCLQYVLTMQVYSEFQSSKFEILCPGEAAKGNRAGYWGLD